MATQPAAGVASLNPILLIYLVVATLFELILAFQIRRVKGWGPVLINGIATLLLGIVLWWPLPLSGAWTIGIVSGVKMVFSGWLLLIIGIAAKEERKLYHLFTC
jgi:uncharacterized membrane protein HdeD (DUF308 family)